MGGKPWQSTGCENCKKRKVKCDKQEPECERCMKRGIQCPGYDQYRIFLHNTPTAHAGDKNKKQLAGSKHNIVTPTQTQAQYLSRARPLIIQHSVASVHNGPLKREQLSSVYVDNYFPDDLSGSTEIDPWYSLLLEVTGLPNKPPMLEKALTAVGCIFLGKRNNDNNMFYHGLQLYNGAIRHMSHHLKRKRNIYSDELVYTVAVFQQLVSIHCPQGLQVWLDQMTVTNGILKYCQYRASQNPTVRLLCVAFHRMRLLQSLSPLQAKEAIDPTADKLPLFLTSREEQPIDELLKLMSEMSPFMTDLSVIDASNLDGYQILLYNCIMHRQKLFDWYEFNVDFFGGRPVTCDTIITNCPPSDYLFGTPYRFTSLDNARAHHGYWAALSILQGLIAQAQSHAYCLSPAQVATNEDYLLSEFYADEISRSLPYCLADDKKAWGPHTSIFGLGQSCKVYTEFRRREKFLFTQEAMKHLGIMGSDFSKRMGEMMLYGWSLVEGVDQSPVVSSSPVEEISPVAEQVVIARVPGPSDCISQETM